jgi:hypothetical protein
MPPQRNRVSIILLRSLSIILITLKWRELSLSRVDETEERAEIAVETSLPFLPRTAIFQQLGGSILNDQGGSILDDQFQPKSPAARAPSLKVAPGLTEFTRIFRGANSFASTPVTASRPALLAVYTA